MGISPETALEAAQVALLEEQATSVRLANRAAADAARRPAGPQDISVSDVEHRFTYHAPSGEAKNRHGELRAEFKAMANVLRALLPAGREKSLAVTALEESSFWAHASVAREPSLHEPS